MLAVSVSFDDLALFYIHMYQITGCRPYYENDSPSDVNIYKHLILSDRLKFKYDWTYATVTRKYYWIKATLTHSLNRKYDWTKATLTHTLAKTENKLHSLPGRKPIISVNILWYFSGIYFSHLLMEDIQSVIFARSFPKRTMKINIFFRDRCVKIVHGDNTFSSLAHVFLPRTTGQKKKKSTKPVFL